MKKENKNPFLKQVVVGFGLIITVFILNGVVSLIEVNTLGEFISKNYRHPLEVSNASLQANRDIIKIHRYMKDVILAGDLTQLQHEINHITVLEKQVYEKFDLIQAEILCSEGRELAKTARQLFVDWQSIREEVIDFVKKGDNGKAAFITQGKGADHVFLLEQRMSDLTSYAGNKADKLIEQAVTLHKRESLFAQLFVVLGILISLTIAFFTIKGVLHSFALRSQAEKDLQKSEKRFRLLVENIPDSIFIFDTHGRFIDANAQTCKTLGYTLDELQNFLVANIDIAFSLENVIQITPAILSNGKTAILQGIHQRKDGSTFPVEIHVNMMEAEGRTLYVALAHDITDRLQAEKAAQQEASLGRIIERSLNEIYIFATDTLRFILVNKGARKNLGYSLDELKNLTPVDIEPELSKEVFEETIKPLMDNEIEQLIYETVQQRQDESIYPVAVHLQKTTYQGTQAFVAIILDISQRKEAEQKILEAFDIINKSASIAFLWKTAEGWPVEFVSDNVLQLTGYSSQELTTGEISYAQIIHPDDLDLVDCEIDQAIKNPDIETFSHTPYRIITKNKEIKWVSDYFYLRKNKKGRITHYQGIVEDITDRKESELALRKSQEEWEKTFNAIPDIITIQDQSMRIIRANKAAYDLLAKKDADLIGKKCYEVFRGSSEPCLGCPGLDAFHNTDGSHSAIIAHKGMGKTFLVVSAPIWDQNKEIQYLVHIAKDITEQKRLEEDLFQAHKMESIGTLAGGIAHDFNNILSVIIGYADMVKGDILAGTGQPGKDIDQILKAGKRAAELVKQILTFSRKTEHHMRLISPHLIVKEALKMMRSSLPTTISIQQDIDPECGNILADPTNVHQIVVNLCTNALHAMEEEKGTLSISLSRKEVRAEQIKENDVSPGDFIVLSISDTGHGMDQETIKRIFEPYFTTKEMGKGTGLGLAVIHGIIKEYKGFIEVESEPGKGTTFHVHIPAMGKDSIIGYESADKDVPLPTGTERILVVDDEDAIVNMNKTALERLGYSVTAVTDSLNALVTIRTNPDQFDLLITDQTMPNMTGFELARKVLRIKPNMPIVLCTGYSSVITEDDALAIGIKQYVKKPVARATLAKTVREALDEN